MFANLDLALTLLQVTSSLAGLTFVATGFIPLLFERVHGAYEEFVAKIEVVMLLRLTKLSFGSFTASVFLSLAWSLVIIKGVRQWLLALLGVSSLLTFALGFTLTAYLLLHYLRSELFGL